MQYAYARRVEPCLELVEQATLSKARLADDEDDLAVPGACALELRLERGEFGLPPRVGREPLARRRFHSRLKARLADHAMWDHRLRVRLQHHGRLGHRVHEGRDDALAFGAQEN